MLLVLPLLESEQETLLSGRTAHSSQLIRLETSVLTFRPHVTGLVRFLQSLPGQVDVVAESRAAL